MKFINNARGHKLSRKDKPKQWFSPFCLKFCRGVVSALLILTLLLPDIAHAMDEREEGANGLHRPAVLIPVNANASLHREEVDDADLAPPETPENSMILSSGKRKSKTSSNDDEGTQMDRLSSDRSREKGAEKPLDKQRETTQPGQRSSVVTYGAVDQNYITVEEFLNGSYPDSQDQPPKLKKRKTVSLKELRDAGRRYKEWSTKGTSFNKVKAWLDGNEPQVEEILERINWLFQTEGASSSASINLPSTFPAELNTPEGRKAAKALLLNEFRYVFEDQCRWPQWAAMIATWPICAFAAQGYSPVITDAVASIFHHRLGLGEYTTTPEVLYTVIGFSIFFALSKTLSQMPQVAKYWMSEPPSWDFLPEYFAEDSVGRFSLKTDWRIRLIERGIKLTDSVLHAAWNTYFLIAILIIEVNEQNTSNFTLANLIPEIMFLIGLPIAEALQEHEQASLVLNQGRSFTARMLKRLFDYELPNAIIPRVSLPYEAFRSEELEKLSQFRCAVGCMPEPLVDQVYDRMFGKRAIFSKEAFQRKYPNRSANHYRMMSGAARVAYITSLAKEIQEEKEQEVQALGNSALVKEGNEEENTFYNGATIAASGGVTIWAILGAAIFLQFAFQLTLEFFGASKEGSFDGSLILAGVSMPFLSISSHVSSLEMFRDRLGRFLPSRLYNAEPDEHSKWMPIRAMLFCLLAIPAAAAFTLPFLQGGLDSTDRFGVQSAMICIRTLLILGFTASIGFGQFGETVKAFVEYWPTLACKTYNGFRTRVLGWEPTNKRDEVMRGLIGHRRKLARYNQEALAFLRYLKGEDKPIEGE